MYSLLYISLVLSCYNHLKVFIKRVIVNYTIQSEYIWTAMCRNVPFDMCGQRRLRSDCASAQADLSPRVALYGYSRIHCFLKADSKDSDQPSRIRKRFEASLGVHVKPFSYVAVNITLHYLAAYVRTADAQINLCCLIRSYRYMYFILILRTAKALV